MKLLPSAHPGPRLAVIAILGVLLARPTVAQSTDQHQPLDHVPYLLGAGRAAGFLGPHFSAPCSGYSVPSRDVNSKTTKCKEKRRDPDVIPPQRTLARVTRPEERGGDGSWRGDCYPDAACRLAPRLRVQPAPDGATRSLPKCQLVPILALVKE